jgi:hypothetical protein
MKSQPITVPLFDAGFLVGKQGCNTAADLALPEQILPLINRPRTWTKPSARRRIFAHIALHLSRLYLHVLALSQPLHYLNTKVRDCGRPQLLVTSAR